MKSLFSWFHLVNWIYKTWTKTKQSSYIYVNICHLHELNIHPAPLNDDTKHKLYIRNAYKYACTIYDANLSVTLFYVYICKEFLRIEKNARISSSMWDVTTTENATNQRIDEISSILEHILCLQFMGKYFKAIKPLSKWLYLFTHTHTPTATINIRIAIHLFDEL